jgi:hypothetical protein
MIAQRFAESNITMKAPAGMPECCDIAAFRGGNQVITAWRPTPEELVKINLGEPIWLGIIGDTMPPVFVTADNPFIQPEEG